jgi:8-oxo-dGTP diphosphatase
VAVDDSAVRVVAAVVERGGRLLVCQRAAGKRHGGLWEFPGGKVEAGESDYHAVRRELREELDVETLEVGTVEFAAADPGSLFRIEFLAVRIAGEPRCIEHERLAWVDGVELMALPLAPSDRRYAEWRQGRATERPDG